jgi:Flp pilus assembly pilin Flp
MLRKQRSRHPGQSLSEYSLLGGIVVLLAIGGIVSLGQSVDGIFENMFASSVSTAGAGGMQVTATNGAPSSAPSPSSSSASSPAGTQGLTITLSSGQQISLNDYPSKLKTSLQTNGANGTTAMLLANLDSVIQQLQAEGQVTDAQANLLIALSNQGHKIAEVEKLIEDALANANGDASKFLNTPITYNGKTYPGPKMLGQEIGFGIMWNTDGAYQDGVMAQQFRALYDQAVAQGALNDPVAQSIVNILTNQIANTADGVETAVYKISIGESSPSGYNQAAANSLTERDQSLGINTQSSLADLPASTITNQDAAGICAAGSGTDGGKSCTARRPDAPGNSRSSSGPSRDDD